MKNLSIVTLIAVMSASALVPSLAMAQGHRGGERPSFETLDTDGDGSITQAEIEAQRDARFAEIDANGDGSVTLEEFTAVAEDRAAERAENMFARLDADGDGALSRDVIERGGGDRAERLIERLDADGDGAVSEEEFAAMVERRGGDRPGRGGPRR